MTDTADFVIIGAGIQGASAAYHIAKRRNGRVVVIEKDRPATGATAASASMVMHQTGNPRLTDLALRAFDSYRLLTDELDTDIEFHTTGSILFASSASGAQKLEEIALYQRQAGIPTEILTADEIRGKTNGLIENESIVLGIYCALDGYINPEKAVEGYLAAARQFGAEVRPHVRATGLSLSDGRIVGVNTERDGEIATDCVINCAGNWASDVGAWARVELPLQSNRRNVLILKPHRMLPGRFPIVEDYEDGWYVRHHADGVLLGVGPTKWIADSEREQSPAYDPIFEDQTKQFVDTYAPYLSPLQIVGSRAGDRPMIHADIRTVDGIPDELPIIGGVPNTAGYFHSCGWGAFGITLGPVGGELIAQVVCGEQPAVDLAPYEWTRFASQLPLKLLGTSI